MKLIAGISGGACVVYDSLPLWSMKLQAPAPRVGEGGREGGKEEGREGEEREGGTCVGVTYTRWRLWSDGFKER